MGRQHAVRQSGRHSRLRSRSTVRGSQRSSQQRVWAALTRKQVMHFFYHHSPLLVVGLWAILIGSAVAAWTSITDPDASIPLRSPTSAHPLADAPQPMPPPAADPSEAAASAPATPSFNLHSHEGTASSQLTPTAMPVPQGTSTAPALRLSQQPTASESPSPVLALWMLALSCATGCLLLFQWAKPRRARTPILVNNRGAQSTAPCSQPVTQPSPELHSLPEASVSTSMPAKAQSTVSSTVSSTPPVPISFTIQPPPRQDSPEPATPAQEVAVTIVPPEHSHPLDWNEPSLADSLDLRQRRPLSYWL